MEKLDLNKYLKRNKEIDKIKELQKPEFVGFIKKLLIFSNVKIAYQGKREVKDLEKQVLKIIK